MAQVYAEVTDVAAEWGPLSDAQKLRAARLLERVSALIRAHPYGAGLDARIAGDEDLAVIVAGVAVEAVLRVLRNPDGKVQESIDDYSYRRSDTVADGELYLTDRELAQLAPRQPPAAGGGGAFTIRPGARGPGPWW